MYNPRLRARRPFQHPARQISVIRWSKLLARRTGADDNNTGAARGMTIAGSDSGAGAGIQADLKTFGALGVFGTCAITTVTAQNTMGVDAALPMPPAMVEAQIDAIMADIGADAVKTGMLPGADIIRCVAQRLELHAVAAAVIDPVLVNRTGTRLFDDDALEAMRSALFPKATVVTPNTREASLLTGLDINTQDDLKNAAKALVEELGARNAVVKGGTHGGASHRCAVRRLRLPHLHLGAH